MLVTAANRRQIIPSNTHIVSCSHDETIRLWDAVSGTPVSVLCGHTGWVCCVAFSPDFKYIASSSADRTIRLWSAYCGEILAIFEAEEIWSIAFSPDGKQIVTGESSGKEQIWNVDVLL
ncbi:hypothetical protein PLEOSDRAFT_1038493 [Pleurotus ostreatus PC15]|uniref:Uncharacterized protein n=1 Tax=Pleurotus ostreatus (strain PC15) TaxID=1137138 RepID=A0A067NNL2_PLEO1|nr:hypothetical protein PLEOSDRAFT_1038493 [Pleurotus ostreatus PC15]